MLSKLTRSKIQTMNSPSELGLTYKEDILSELKPLVVDFVMAKAYIPVDVHLLETVNKELGQSRETMISKKEHTLGRSECGRQPSLGISKST